MIPVVSPTRKPLPANAAKTPEAAPARSTPITIAVDQVRADAPPPARELASGRRGVPTTASLATPPAPGGGGDV